MKGEIVKTFSTSRLVEARGEKTRRGVHGDTDRVQIRRRSDADAQHPLGGEESGGIGFGHFLPERDGILSGLLVAECVAHYGKPLSEIIAAMEEEFGALYYDRRDVNRSRSAAAHSSTRARAGVVFDGVTNVEEKDA